ncbi:hypothetical protein G7Y79_00020g048500 [Physcia stellaris]|nr:hypothetical protein G7Y79_00020g048500 [Physcia stellaris]
MTVPYICLRCRQRLPFRYIQCRNTSFVSLQQLVKRDGKELGDLADKDAERSMNPENHVERSQTTDHRPTKLSRLKREPSNNLEDLFSSNLHNSHAFVEKHLEHSSPSARELVQEDFQALAHRFYRATGSLLELWSACHNLLRSEKWQALEAETSVSMKSDFLPGQVDVFRDILFEIAHQNAENPKKKPRMHTLPDEKVFGINDDKAEKPLFLAWTTMYQQRSFESCTLSYMPLERVKQIWPQYPGSDHRTIDLILAAVMTLNCFEPRKTQIGSSDDLLTDAEPLIGFLKRLVQGVKIKRDTVGDCLERKRIPDSLGADILRGWVSLGIDISIDSSTNTSKSIGINSPTNTPVSTTSLKTSKQNTGVRSYEFDALKALNVSITQAKEREDVASLSKQWIKFQELFKSSEPEPSLCDHIFSNLLTSFFAVKRQSQAVEVWNFMIAKGHQPTQKHWHAMLRGCAKARDLASLRDIWSNMLSAGVNPDSSTWTTWIHGLMVCGVWQAGLEALEALGNQWKTHPFNEALQPSLDPVRAALSGLVLNRRFECINRIHEFAKTHQLTYDIQTYNILLRPAIRSDDDQKVQELFKEIRASGCEPDIGTFTIILNGLLSNPTTTFYNQSLPEQQAAISRILGDMERAGVVANARTYSTILDGLLNDRSMNIGAAQEVIQHMATNHVKISPHIYTILITHYFSLEPPNLLAVSDLLHRAKLEKVPLDPIFHDRMIENYARVGEVERMLKALGRMPEVGMTPGWIALTGCLRTLADAGEWDLVRDLVRDVQDEKGLFRHGTPTRWKGKDGFWELVAEIREGGFLS